jgi:hypothetical protein
LNHKIVSTKRNRTIFLAIVLFAGMITLSFPSFIIVDAFSDRIYHYENDYSEDSYRDNNYEPEYNSYSKDKNNKSQDNTVSLKKFKCSINNININGIELNLGLPNMGVLNGLSNSGGQATTAEDEEQTTTANNLEMVKDKTTIMITNKKIEILRLLCI